MVEKILCDIGPIDKNYGDWINYICYQNQYVRRAVLVIQNGTRSRTALKYAVMFIVANLVFITSKIVTIMESSINMYYEATGPLVFITALIPWAN